MHLADDLIAPGGPSAPVWAFLTALMLGVLTLIGQQLKERAELKRIRAQAKAANDNAVKAAEKATEAHANTIGVSNGFVGRVEKKLDRIYELQQSTDERLKNHLEWHLDRSD